MKSLILSAFCVVVFAFVCDARLYAQLPKQVTVLVQAKVKSSPTNRVELTWPADTQSKGYEVARKERSWSSFIPMESLPGSATSWIDSTIEEGISYEYSVVNTITKDTTYGFGYVSAGVKVPVMPYRGQILVLADDKMTSLLAAELATLNSDLVNEGWLVTFRSVQRAEKFDTAAVRVTKSLIRDWYQTLDGAPATVFIVGRVAVPYSGMVYQGQNQPGPDGHPEHSGAWAADTYYGCMIDDFMWKDEMTNTAGVYADNKNLPGDGRFDNLLVPGNIDIRIGRVDLYNMGLFYHDSVKVGSKVVIDSLTSERNLLKAYLQRDHAYRTGALTFNWRGLIDDNFGGYGEQFARCGWMNYAALLGRDKIFETDYISNLDTTSYLWSYGCGGGGSDFQSAGGVGTSANIAAKKLNTAFTMLFGSYFGDWDKPNNLLRAPLAVNPGALTNCWAGRPFWFFHTMALGETIGDCTMLSENNNNQYVEGIYTHGVHMALMGDPTLRMSYGRVEAPVSVRVEQLWSPKESIRIGWVGPHSGEYRSFYVYRTDPSGTTTVLNDGNPVLDTFFIDTQFFEGNVRYEVRTIGLLTSSSGSFNDLSPATGTSRFITSVKDDETLGSKLQCYPNPSRSTMTLGFSLMRPSSATIQIFNTAGDMVRSIDCSERNSGEQRIVWDLLDAHGEAVPSGLYVIRVNTATETRVEKVSVIR